MKKTPKSHITNDLSISQNFITNTRLLRKIVNISNITATDTVLEIGTGKGHLAQALCRKCRFLYSVEMDAKLFEQTRYKLAHLPNLKLIQGDFLKLPLPVNGQYKVFANIPYSITTQIIDKLTGAPNPPLDMWLVMEKGAAKRFMGKPAENKRSLLLKVGWNMKIEYYFNRNDFHPAPSVDSVLLHLSRKKTPDLTKDEFSDYEHFIAHSLRYGISGGKGLLTKRQVSTALRLAELPPLAPGGEILYIQWLCLFRCYRKFHI